MTHDESAQAETFKLPRRRFMRAAAAGATAALLPPSLLAGCRATNGSAASNSNALDVMDEALDMMSKLAPLTNHGPMAAEALVALGRADKVIPWVEGYKKRFAFGYPEARRPLTRENWREALGDGDRVTDWTNFFGRELEEAAWPQVLERWSAELAPGLAAAAAHGLIRTGHAVRSLSGRETDLRRRELAAGLGYWAAYYQPLPEAQNAKAERLTPAQAVERVPLLPTEKRSGAGSIMVGLQRLKDFPPFSGAADLVETTDDASRFLSELTETFATVYLKNVNRGNVITLVHTITGATAIRSLLPFLSPPTTRRALRYGWQVAAALYSISGSASPNRLPEAEEIKPDDLTERAAASQDEHAIKFTEACLREYKLNPKPVYLQAARDAVGRL